MSVCLMHWAKPLVITGLGCAIAGIPTQHTAGLGFCAGHKLIWHKSSCAPGQAVSPAFGHPDGNMPAWRGILIYLREAAYDHDGIMTAAVLWSPRLSIQSITRILIKSRSWAQRRPPGF